MNHDSDKSCCNVTGLMWWMTLLLAVLAIPSVGFIVANAISVKNSLGEVVVFILACWACTYLGMRLMQTPMMSQKIKLKK